MVQKHKVPSPKTGSFQAMNLAPELLQGITHMGYRQPTPVQRKSIPVCLLGGDVVCMARTGSGKTAAFVLPMLQRLMMSISNQQSQVQSFLSTSSVKAVIISPTRELCLQTMLVCRKLARYVTDPKEFNIVSIIGGDGMEKQFLALASKPDIIVATPGRFAHHLSEIPDFDLSSCEVVVFDEADRLFELGFTSQIREITNSMPEYRQTLMFSATMPKMLAEFARSGLHDPTVIRLDNEASVSEELRIGFLTCRSSDKDAALLYLLQSLLNTNTDQSNTAVATEEKKSMGNSDNDDSNDNKTRGGKHKKERRDKLTLIFAATRHHVDFLTYLIRSSGIDATSIYGTMDLEARKTNLASFRNGDTPVLVVTDVAARGIDVPLIHTVIHHSFPSSAKLFVHRSGRAARAGRIGYCLSLVEPDEMPYMVELHLFLGRKLTTSKIISENSSEESDIKEETLKYAMDEMTPDMVHWGSIPESIITDEVENYRRLLENESGNKDAENLQLLFKTCNNAMKQYRRSRPEASKSSVRTAKQLLSKPIPAHPLLAHIVSNDPNDPSRKIEDIMAREEFLLNLRKLKTKETIFESMARDGGSTNAGSIDRTRNTASAGSNTFAIMKSMRRQMRLVQNKHSLIVAGTDTAKARNGELIEDDQNDDEGHISELTISEKQDEQKSDEKLRVVLPVITQKKRMSKAERKRTKVNKTGKATELVEERKTEKKGKDKLKGSFRDNQHYISFAGEQYQASERERHMEAQLLPSSGESKHDQKLSALKLQESILDIVGDEQADLVKRHRLMRWDKSKGKYVQTTIGEETSGLSKSKKLRLESGQLINKKDAKLGELYEKWQKKNNGLSIGRIGIFDEVDDMGESTGNAAAMIRGRHDKKNKADKKSKVDTEESLKTSAQIHKERSKKGDDKIKNMKKRDRRDFESQKNDSKSQVKKGDIGKKRGKIWSARSRRK